MRGIKPTPRLRRYRKRETTQRQLFLLTLRSRLGIHTCRRAKCARLAEKEFQMYPAAPFLSTLLHRVKAVARRVARQGFKQARVAPVGTETPAATAGAPPAATLAATPGWARDWMSGRLLALSALIRRIEAREMPGGPEDASDTAMGIDALAGRGPAVPEEREPCGFGWMCALDPCIREVGSAFAAWLGEPGMRARVLAAPEPMVRAISPILWAVGQERPAWFAVAGELGENRLCPGAEGLRIEAKGSGGLGDAVAGSRDGVVGEAEARSVIPPPAPPTRGEGVSYRGAEIFVPPALKTRISSLRTRSSSASCWVVSRRPGTPRHVFQKLEPPDARVGLSILLRYRNKTAPGRGENLTLRPPSGSRPGRSARRWRGGTSGRWR
jgi:hypothetical protein